MNKYAVLLRGRSHDVILEIISCYLLTSHERKESIRYLRKYHTLPTSFTAIKRLNRYRKVMR